MIFFSISVYGSATSVCLVPTPSQSSTLPSDFVLEQVLRTFSLDFGFFSCILKWFQEAKGMVY